MIVYHGSTVEITKPLILTNEIGRDFGFAFYTTVMQGIMRKEDAIERLKFERINNQIAFCTEKALEHLTFVSSYEVN